MSFAILYGVSTIFVLAIIASLIFSTLLRFTALTESSISLVVMIVTFLSIFIGGFVSGGKGRKQGILLGGGTGIVYLAIILLFQYLGHDSLFSVKQWVSYGCFVVTATMGGILGVNISKGE
ncbi:TIGR04086 family membrane protein [Peribacillus asahii]|uniref:TIGR04086 family membrane protein n=1 Tax=Peribacillus asahii TaxID=228899 RepID=UPI00207A288F|nr:TIGR04086 family membrane protein [Peribacillus asahii]USK58933.1 TIGR04086 family membrane protein [Peribacillus asahii]USK69344.1 TIGR04086 family membrane protein [Peribacillus asahii]